MAYRVPVLETYSWQKQVGGMLEAPPTSPAPTKGDRYIVSDTTSLSGAFIGHADDIAWFDGAAWQFDTPSDGWITLDTSAIQPKMLIYFESGWQEMPASMIRVDNSQFTTQIPSDVDMTLQELLEWMDVNFGGKGPLGAPSDGGYEDGLLEWTENTQMNDAIDDLNEVVKDLAPPRPLSLEGLTLDFSDSYRTAKVAAGVNWNGASDGETLNNIITDNDITVTSPNQTDAFGVADETALKAEYRNDPVGSWIEAATFDITNNFYQEPNGTRPEYQDLTGWNTQGDCAIDGGTPATPTTGGSGNGYTQLAFTTGGGGYLRITEVARYNDFNMWQKMNANIRLNALPAGYNAVRMVHDYRSDLRESNIREMYYDDANGQALSFSTPCTVQEGDTLNYSYLSGVQYYAAGTTFDVNFTLDNLFNKTYATTNVASVSMTGCAGDNFAPADCDNIAGIPNYNDQFVMTFANTGANQLTVNSSVYQTNARATASGLHPYKTNATSQSPSENRHILSYSGRSDNITEDWLDEDYRLPLSGYDFDSYAGSMTGNWNSQNALGANDLLVYNQTLRYANLDLSGILPAGNPNMSGAAGAQQYVRAFTVNSSTNTTLIIPGLSVGDIDPVGTGEINVEVKLPTQTGWLDAGAPYNGGTFGGNDGDGCQVGTSSGSTFNLTFGTNSTANSGNRIYVRVTFRTATSKTINSNFRVA